jgi:hypothetical protein
MIIRTLAWTNWKGEGFGFWEGKVCVFFIISGSGIPAIESFGRNTYVSRCSLSSCILNFVRIQGHPYTGGLKNEINKNNMFGTLYIWMWHPLTNGQNSVEGRDGSKSPDSKTLPWNPLAGIRIKASSIIVHNYSILSEFISTHT